MAEVAAGTTEALRRLVALFRADQVRIEALGRPAAATLRLHLLLQRTPVVNVGTVARELGLSQPTAAKALARLAALGIVAEATGRQRGRIFIYPAYLAILDHGTEPLPR